jgi:hypothetical protein
MNKVFGNGEVSEGSASFMDESEQDGTYKVPQHVQFIYDMAEAGLETSLMHYCGRNFWSGPAVAVHDLQDALSSTKVPCQWESLGLDFVVYPKANDSALASRKHFGEKKD